MRVEILSKFAVWGLIKNDFPNNTAVISFYTPINNSDKYKVDYQNVCDSVFYVAVPDINVEGLEEYGYTTDTFLSEVNDLADFIYDAKEKNKNIICQCDFGRGRSAACAAAILEHFEKRGKDIFMNDQYYPNKLVYQKVLSALEEKCK
jgi:protein-tyrosine phosphatase